jgi:Do/DeqQ family serine protease
MNPQTARAIVVGAALFAFAGVGFAIYGWLATPGAAGRVATPSPMGTADALQAAFVTVAEQVRPAVVHLGTVQVARSRRPSVVPGPSVDDPFFKDFFDQFFGRGGPGQREEFRTPGLGSGVIIDKRGYVLTNFHVVKGADGVTVRLPSKQEFRGRIVGSDPKTDLAVIKFEPEGELRVASLGNSDTLRVGEWAIAIGNPFGLDQTVTVGVVSAVGRADVGIATYENFIQTDASINPGNSGGPLVNLRGEVIGINTAIVATGQGIGFAIPANMVKRVTGQLIDRGKVMRGWIGVSLQPMSKELAQALGLPDTKGAIVTRVYPGSPAESAGLAPNDVVTRFDGVVVEDYHHLQRLSSDAEVGRTVKLDYVRKGQRKTVELKIAESPDSGGATR